MPLVFIASQTSDMARIVCMQDGSVRKIKFCFQHMKSSIINLFYYKMLI